MSTFGKVRVWIFTVALTVSIITFSDFNGYHDLPIQFSIEQVSANTYDLDLEKFHVFSYASILSGHNDSYISYNKFLLVTQQSLFAVKFAVQQKVFRDYSSSKLSNELKSVQLENKGSSKGAFKG